MRRDGALPITDQHGSILVMAVVMTLVLVVTGLAFLKFVDSEVNSVDRALDRRLTMWACQAGISEGLANLQGHPELWGEGQELGGTELLPGVKFRSEASVRATRQELYSYGFEYWIVATGEGDYSHHGDPVKGQIWYSTKVNTFADYLYLTDKEHDYLGTVIRFWGPDTLDGKVHSNDIIHLQAVQGRPVFYKTVSSCSTRFDPDASFGQFFGQPPHRLPVSKIYFPVFAQEVRENAAPDHFYNPGHRWTWVRFESSYYMMRSSPDSGTTWFPETWEETAKIPLPKRQAIFVNGVTWVETSSSVGLDGRVTLGSSDTLFIRDHIRYAGSDYQGNVPETCDDCLGLISEKWILVHDRAPYDITINAGLAAIGDQCSFSIHRCYNYNYTHEKGTLKVYGSIAQRYRGKVHTTQYGGNRRGYVSKKYNYDQRFVINPPPHFIKVAPPVSLWIEFWD
jgi:hypothetical protein